MIVVLASSHDRAARALVARQCPGDAALLTCDNLSVPGWRHYLAAAGTPIAVIGGREVAVEEIAGVISCLPSVPEFELIHIRPADRAYVAAEMTAFLVSWLSTLACPVVNRPSPACLAGPYWRPEQWTYAASQVGMRVQPVYRRAALAGQPVPDIQKSIPVTVIGERCLGQADPVVLDGARRLARTANVEMLEVHVSSPEPDAIFQRANPWPDLACRETADAILEHIKEKTSSLAARSDPAEGAQGPFPINHHERPS